MITRRFYTPEVDLFAFRINNQLSHYVARYPDPGSVATDAFLQHWRQWTVFIHAPIVLLPRILQKLRQDQATGLVIAPTWPGQPWFPALLELLVDFPAQLQIAEGTIFLPFEQQAIHPMWKTGLSPEVCKILLAPWRTSTQKRYEGHWQQWASWCLERNKCPFSAPVADVLDFLSEQFNDRNLAYRTVGVYKACISQMHDPVDGLHLGSLPLVSRFMKGIFQLRPATPRICTTWQVGPVLRSLSSLEPVEQLSLKVLSVKLTTLLALTSAARAHEIVALHLDHLSKKVDSCEFIIHTHVKNSRPYHPPRKIFLGRYQHDCSICVVRCLEHYLQRTSNHRRYKELLLSYVNPYKPVGSQTVSRWICTLIRLAGMDVCYTGHSTRAASTSEAVDNGVPLEVVLEAAD